MTHIFSSGKLLLTSEYIVLDGALALAVPTQLGQELYVAEQPGNGIIRWEAYHQGKEWLNAEIDYLNWKILNTNLPKNANFIQHTLQNVQKLSSTKLQSSKDYHLKTNLQFPPNYGLGSSSTLMANLAKWAEIDAFHLNEISLGGSGYDIAVAMQNSAITYQLSPQGRKISPIEYAPSYKDKLIFIHLNQKQDSREGIRLFKSKERSQTLVKKFSEITKAILENNNLNDFSELMTEHEIILSKFLNIPTVKERYFSDCPSFVKSLGAWGGDFIMSSKFEGYQQYFSRKGFSTIFNFNELIK